MPGHVKHVKNRAKNGLIDQDCADCATAFSAAAFADGWCSQFEHPKKPYLVLRGGACATPMPGSPKIDFTFIHLDIHADIHPIEGILTALLLGVALAANAATVLTFAVVPQSRPEQIDSDRHPA